METVLKACRDKIKKRNTPKTKNDEERTPIEQVSLLELKLKDAYHSCF